MRTTKGEKIETLARVTYTGARVVGAVAWETPVVCLQLLDPVALTFTGPEVSWCSPAAARASEQLRAGDDVSLSGFRYGRNMRRVQLGWGSKIFGIGQ